MESNQHNFLFPPADQGGGACFSNAPPGTFFGGMVLPPGVKPLRPFHGVEVQPSEACPKNFIIFDQTDNRSKIVYHPAIGSHIRYPGFNFGACPFQDNVKKNYAHSEEEISSYQKDDSEDIDVLLSLETEDNEESDEEEVSTARTERNCGSNSPDSCSNYGSHPKKCRLPAFRKSSASGSSCSGRKRQKMRKMVKALRGIVPGAGQMNTVAVLDEAVRYLKSLKVEVQKLGVGNMKRYI